MILSVSVLVPPGGVHPHVGDRVGKIAAQGTFGSTGSRDGGRGSFEMASRATEGVRRNLSSHLGSGVGVHEQERGW
jgi:hypothetical protein